MKTEFRFPKNGDILVSSWGYDATITDFFQVVSVSKSGKSVVISPIAKKRVGGSSVVPVPNRFVETGLYPKRMRRKVHRYSDGTYGVKVTHSYAYLHEKTTPKYETPTEMV